MYKWDRFAGFHAALLHKLALSLLLAGAWIWGAGSPAQARPRDQVMSAAFRCAPISDSRVWLDCYYGAAQPARAALGLQPAPAAQVKLAASPETDGAPPKDVAVRDEVLSGAFRCNGASGERQWLDCYYTAAQPLRVVLGLPSAPQARVASAPSEREASAIPQPVVPVAGAPIVHPAGPDQNFGLPASVRAGPKVEADRIVSRMASYTFDTHGVFTATLENGQVWQQVAGDTTIAHWKKPPGSYVIRITHGFMGSYNLQVKDLPGLYKVMRVS